jgi:hypothetical protein
VDTHLLRNQLEIVRFERALEVSESLADHRALLTVSELARLNQILTGKKIDPWRNRPVEVTLPSGRIETLTLITEPKNNVREKVHRATERAESGDAVDAAVDIYIELVLAHPFEDANRRTAVVASHYFLRRYSAPVSGMALHELQIGDLREDGQTERLRNAVHQMVKFGEKRRARNQE